MSRNQSTLEVADIPLCDMREEQHATLTLSGPQPDFSDNTKRHYKTNTRILRLG